MKVSGLSHNRAKQSDPRITWFMLHKIYYMYSDINNKEESKPFGTPINMSGRVGQGIDHGGRGGRGSRGRVRGSIHLHTYIK